MKRGPLSRRSFLMRVTGGALCGGGALALVAEKAMGQRGRSSASRPARPRRMVADGDPNDPARSGTTDADRGASADRPGNGRQPLPEGYSGFTNADRGDPPGNGRAPVANNDPVDAPASGRLRTRGGPAPAAQGPQQRIVICPGNTRCPR
jgi:hypothetical protein